MSHNTKQGRDSVQLEGIVNGTLEKVATRYLGKSAKGYEALYDEVLKAMKEYAEIKCREQRQIIAEGLPDRCFVEMDESWITSMEPPEFN